MYWLEILQLHSIVAFLYYNKLFQYLNDIGIVIEIAENLNQAIIFEVGHSQPEPERNQAFEFVVTQNEDSNIFLSLEETERRELILTEQIKSEVPQINRKIRGVQIFNGLINQLLIIWVIYQSTMMEPVDACYKSLIIFQMIFLIISLFQYWEGYILCIVLLISLPFFLLMVLWNKLKEKKQNYQNKQILNELIKQKMVVYQNENVQGDQECGICLQVYCRNEELLILPCNQQHHFHLHCIKTWLILNFRCPKCRSYINDIRNTQSRSFL
ncbi:unnamed protein product [Paramecium sonneborni]|uniref:RING-type domain-containing protein n=1 Tax=Paramecium sonneborni TaxID=65129 RepID=A0A8S1QYY3_9CILI|nr:unnamed protein product [Paramecium sonneborni]CAD8120988.1 unnamed protein product [Paramecium sonneborni]